LQGCDLTERAIEHTKNRFDLLGLKTNLQVADAENLPYQNEQFDAVYSWGVIHHSPNTPKAVDEILRVLKPGGTAKVMIYHKHSMVGYMLWLRYALLKLKPFTSLKERYSSYLERPGIKAYTTDEAANLFHQFSKVEIETVLTHGDLLSSNAGQRHKGLVLTLAKALFPRWIIKTFFPKHGLFMLITAVK
jgi:ubiquinone/menaquinone biosynthesis C-methylase UbiE